MPYIFLHNVVFFNIYLYYLSKKKKKNGTISLLRFQMDFEYNSYRLYQDRRELTIEVKGSEANKLYGKT